MKEVYKKYLNVGRASVYFILVWVFRSTPRTVKIPRICQLVNHRAKPGRETNTGKRLRTSRTCRSVVLC